MGKELFLEQSARFIEGQRLGIADQFQVGTLASFFGQGGRDPQFCHL